MGHHPLVIDPETETPHSHAQGHAPQTVVKITSILHEDLVLQNIVMIDTGKISTHHRHHQKDATRGLLHTPKVVEATDPRCQLVAATTEVERILAQVTVWVSLD